jgi:hypothetical protein
MDMNSIRNHQINILFLRGYWMKLKAREYASKYRFVTLFREDLNEIIRIFFSSFDKIDVDIDIYEIESTTLNGINSEIDKIQTKTGNDSIKEVAIKGYGDLNKILLEFRLNEFNLSKLIIHDIEDTTTLGVFTIIDLILEKSESILLNIITSYKFISVLALIGLVISCFFFISKLDRLVVINIINIGMLLVSISIFLLYYGNIKEDVNTAHLEYSKPNINFFKRNQDKIIIAVISAFLAFILSNLSKIIF